MSEWKKLSELMKKTDMPEEVCRQVHEICSGWEDGDVYVLPAEAEDLLRRERQEEALNILKEELRPDPDGLKMLSVQLILAVRSAERSPWQEILSEHPDVYERTMVCFSRFVKEYQVSYGRYGFDREWWTPRQLCGRLFRLGELEYELDPEDHRIWMHIPGRSSLSAESIEDSYSREQSFMREYFPEAQSFEIRCESWLLSLVLKNFLGDSSKILGFQRYFEITGVNPDADDYLEWVFNVAGGQRKAVKLEELPESTSLQKKIKQYVLQGGRIGTAEGIFHMPAKNQKGTGPGRRE